MTETPVAPQQGLARWSKIVLFTSLALNLLVIGLVAGMILRHGGDGRQPPLRDLGYGPFGAALSGPDRTALAVGMMGRAGDLQSNREDLRQQFREMLAILRTRPFDAPALESLVDRQRAKLAERQAIGQRLLLDRIEAMTEDERFAFADRLELNLRHGDHDRRR